MRSICVFAFACLLPIAAQAGPRNQGYSPLTGDQIRETFSDHTFTPGGRGPMRFTSDGRVEGGRDANAWSVEGDTLCLQGAQRACYDVWLKGRSVQMFAGENESEGTLTGVLQ